MVVTVREDILVDMDVREPKLAFTDIDVAIAKGDMPLAKGLHLAPNEDEARLQGLFDSVAMPPFTVCRDDAVVLVALAFTHG